METTAAKPEVFSRKASGLSRVMSPWSAFIYNFLTMGVIFPWTFVWAPEAFPGVSVWMACLFAMLLELPIALAYVWMATAMPRSGGDYVFQSRVLGGAIGFPIVMSGFVIWILQWVALAGWLFANLGLAPLFMGLGVHYNSTGLINAGIWVESQPGVVVISIIGAALDGDAAGDGLQELRPPAVLHVRRHRHPRGHHARPVPAHERRPSSPRR